ncbi:MAG: hypothetical protein AAF213_12525 [Pseudomonadota bacterium]
MYGRHQAKLYAHHYRPDFMECVTLQAIGAVTGITKLKPAGSNRPDAGLDVTKLVGDIDGVLEAQGDQMGKRRDMVVFLRSVRDDLSALGDTGLQGDIWARHRHEMIRHATGSAETLFNRHFVGYEAEAYNPARPVTEAMHQRRLPTARI